MYLFIYNLKKYMCLSKNISFWGTFLFPRKASFCMCKNMRSIRQETKYLILFSVHAVPITILNSPWHSMLFLWVKQNFLTSSFSWSEHSTLEHWGNLNSPWSLKAFTNSPFPFSSLVHDPASLYKIVYQQSDKDSK